MEQPKDDEEIVCASCGVTFVFTAAAAAARAERGNTTKPTMCKPCWRAKASNGERRNFDAPARSPAQHGRAPQRPTQPNGWGYRTTGDVNEYRSPMADPHFPTAHHPQGRRGGWGDGNYRAPSFQNEQRSGTRFPSRDRAPANRNLEGEPARMRSHVSTNVTCNACGTSATVPFKPNEGQKVYCQACYRAEKPT